jgi:hypothetical protein
MTNKEIKMTVTTKQELIAAHASLSFLQRHSRNIFIAKRIWILSQRNEVPFATFKENAKAHFIKEGLDPLVADVLIDHFDFIID